VQPPRQRQAAAPRQRVDREAHRGAGGKQGNDEDPHHHVLEHVSRQPLVGLDADPGVEIGHQHSEPSDEADAAGARPAATAPVATIAADDREQVKGSDRDEQHQERGRGAVDQPVERERAEAHQLVRQRGAGEDG
jgi:hypothetical protein